MNAKRSKEASFCSTTISSTTVNPSTANNKRNTDKGAHRLAGKKALLSSFMVLTLIAYPFSSAFVALAEESTDEQSLELTLGDAAEENKGKEPAVSSEEADAGSASEAESNGSASGSEEEGEDASAQKPEDAAKTSTLKSIKNFDLNGLSFIVLSDDGTEGTVEIRGYDLPFDGNIPSTVSPAHTNTVYKVVSVGDFAFDSCMAFQGVLYLGENISSLGRASFAMCYGISEIYATNASHLSIGDAAFAACGNIKRLSFKGASVSIAEQAFVAAGFKGAVTIPAAVTSIGAVAFCSPGRTVSTLLFEGKTAPSMPRAIVEEGVVCYYNAAGEESYLAQPGLPQPAYPMEMMALQSPSSAVATVGESISLYAEVLGGTEPFTYTWREYPSLYDATNDPYGLNASEAVTLSDDDVYSGTETSTLTLPATRALSGNYYRCFVSDSHSIWQQAAATTPIQLTVNQASPVVSATKLALQGRAGAFKDIRITAALSQSYLEPLELACAIDDIEVTQSCLGDGSVSLTFAAKKINTLAEGSYDIVISSEATENNEAVADTVIGTLKVLPRREGTKPAPGEDPDNPDNPDNTDNPTSPADPADPADPSSNNKPSDPNKDASNESDERPDANKDQAGEGTPGGNTNPPTQGTNTTGAGAGALPLTGDNPWLWAVVAVSAILGANLLPARCKLQGEDKQL